MIYCYLFLKNDFNININIFLIKNQRDKMKHNMQFRDTHSSVMEKIEVPMQWRWLVECYHLLIRKRCKFILFICHVCNVQ